MTCRRLTKSGDPILLFIPKRRSSAFTSRVLDTYANPSNSFLFQLRKKPLGYTISTESHGKVNLAGSRHRLFDHSGSGLYVGARGSKCGIRRSSSNSRCVEAIIMSVTIEMPPTGLDLTLSSGYWMIKASRRKSLWLRSKSRRQKSGQTSVAVLRNLSIQRHRHGQYSSVGFLFL